MKINNKLWRFRNNRIIYLLLAIIGLCLILFLAITQYIQSSSAINPTPPPEIRTATLVKATSLPSPVGTATNSANKVNPQETSISTKISEIKPVLKLPKDSYSIALIGDSMVETMGENTDYLQKSLSAKYPNTQFKLYNYGMGGQNIEQGLGRFSSPFNYKTRNYPPLSDIDPDILIVGSFSYNPFPQHDREKHTRLLQSLLNQGRGNSGKVYLLAEIAPLKKGFGEGPVGVNWPAETATLQSLHISELLEDTVALAKLENVPLINTYQPSKVDGGYGNKSYVSSHDGIHPSVTGHVYMADFIANSLKF